jgi:hypothetical protein
MRKLLTLAVLALLAVGSAWAQADGPSGRTALIISYRAKPESRVKFLGIMKTEGTAQFERWKKKGIFASYQMLTPAYAGAGVTPPDLFVVLRFPHFTDLAAWQAIEKTIPGGLPLSAQAIAYADTSSVADIIKEDSVAPPTKSSQYFIVMYDVLISNPAYKKYAMGYVIPQFDAWMKAGILSSYAAYLNQNPPGAPWTSFIVLEYKDIDGLGQREIVKDKAREMLAATNPEWKKWSEDKSNIRKEKNGFSVVPLH